MMMRLGDLRAVPAGGTVAVLSPAWAAPAYFPAIHEQAMRRLEELFDVRVREYPTTRQMGATPAERASDLNDAFADDSVDAIMTSVGGDDLVRVIPLLDPDSLSTPKRFFGYSDTTNILNWLWGHGIPSLHGGATQVHLGPGPTVDALHLETLHAALRGGDVTITGTNQSEDFGLDWSDPAALTEPSSRGLGMPIEFVGSEDPVRGRTWGGCMEVIDQMALADRLPPAEQLEGAILLFETSEILPPPDFVGRWVRALGERGYLEAAAGIAFARPVVQDRDNPAPARLLEARMEAYTEYLLSNIAPYTTEITVALGVPFGHTKPQAVLPHGGEITLDPRRGAIVAHFD